MKKRFIEIAVKVVVAALTAFLTAITTTSCMGYGPLYGPLPKIVQISQMKNPLAVAGGFLHSRRSSSAGLLPQGRKNRRNNKKVCHFVGINLFGTGFVPL